MPGYSKQSYFGDRYDRLEWQLIRECARRYGLTIDVAREIVKFVSHSLSRAEQYTYDDWRDD